VAIREANEPISHCSHQSAHEQFASHRVGAPTNIICVWKAVRWAFESFVPVKVTLGPTNVDGITASMISCENSIRISLGGVAGSRSPSSRVPAWFCRSLCNSSFERHISLFVARDAPNQPGCVLGLLLTQPLLLEGPTSFP